MRETAKPDDTDRKIMNLLHTNARMPVAEIGRHISMTQPAVRERIHKLEEQGIITAYKAKFDPGKLDRGIQAFMLFKTVKCREFVRYCDSSPEVAELYRISGEFNYMLKTRSESMESLAEFQDTMMVFGVSNTLMIMHAHVEDKSPF
ncbi:Lrp/AsnC family transcriptional regulator [Paenibacillus chitinolyticus]|uniref:Lrp/AsnC family transcriptional regulator n=1 Tax=Paenibacillus chitinolyticus TaxID=79263 RepID=UPI00364ADB3A